MRKMRVQNVKCQSCGKCIDNLCTAGSYRDCKLASIQFAVSQFEQMLKSHCGKEPAQVLLASVLSQAVLDSLHMKQKVASQYNPKEAREFLNSKYARSTCEIIGIDYCWFIETTENFISAVKTAGLKSVGKSKERKEV